MNSEGSGLLEMMVVDGYIVLIRAKSLPWWNESMQR